MNMFVFIFMVILDATFLSGKSNLISDVLKVF